MENNLIKIKQSKRVKDISKKLGFIEEFKKFNSKSEQNLMKMANLNLPSDKDYEEGIKLRLKKLYENLNENDTLGKIKKCYEYLGENLECNLEEVPKEKLEELKKKRDEE
jgi:hypothetical protein